MEFTLMCPTDGQVELGIEDISAIMFRGTESLDVVFVCPHCGTSLKAELRIPNLLVAAMELARRAEEGEVDVQGLRRRTDIREEVADAAAEAELRARREREGEPYCEYFRRQLSRVETVEDLLKEFE